MKFKKQHILVAALILALGAAVYLNWQFSGTPMISETSKELGAATYVSNDAAATADEVLKTSGEPDAEGKLAKARTERTQAQDKALSEAKNVLELSDSSDDARVEAVRAAETIENRILAQSNIENILEAKGFHGAMCYIADGGCTVTVRADELKDDSPVIIKDAVLSQSDVEFNNIIIVDVE